MDPFLNLTEKYRPQKIDEIVGQERSTNRFKVYVKNGNMPHLLFGGPPGSGKTASARALARELLGERWRENYHEYNAGSTRGIDFIRGTIKDLCSVEPMGTMFQIVMLDECDGLTTEAQEALRQTMMAHTSTSKFVLCCNYMYKVIEPIQDRCRVFRFGRVKEVDIVKKLSEVCKLEGVESDYLALLHIANRSRGSVRTALEHLQTYIEEGQKITLDLVEDDMPTILREDVADLIKAAKTNKPDVYNPMLFKMFYQGFHPREIIEAILDELDADVKDEKYPRYYKERIVSLLGECDWRCTQGANDLLQFRCMLREFGKVV